MQSRQVAIKILKRIEETNAYADITIDNELSRSNLSSLDKAFVNEIVNGTIRWRGHLDWLIRQFYQGEINKCPTLIKYILQVSLYQLIYLDKVPAYAAINEGVALAKQFAGNYWAGKVNAILRTFLRKKDHINYPAIDTDVAGYVAIKYSHPRWIVERWIDRYGIEETQRLCEANNKTPDFSIRVNQLKVTQRNIQHILKQFGIDTIPSVYLVEFLKTSHLPELTNFEPFQKGLFSIQDESAGLVAHLIDPKPGEIIIDLCAAPGGKTTHLAEICQNQCRILAVDKNFNRLLLLRQNIRRLNLSNIYLLNANATQLAGINVDKVLIDAPCSGLGVLAKRSDLRWKRTAEQIEQMARLQRQMLNNAATLVKKGGVLVYSTCTIEPDENEDIVNHFLADHHNFTIDNPANFLNEKLTFNNKYVYTFPHIHNTDGSFSVRLVKSN